MSSRVFWPQTPWIQEWGLGGERFRQSHSPPSQNTGAVHTEAGSQWVGEEGTGIGLPSDTPGWLGMTSRGCRPGAGGPSRPHSAIVPALLPADRLLSLTLLAFEGLSAAASKDRCLACIEEPFFSPLWPLLLALYRYDPSTTPHRAFPLLPTLCCYPQMLLVFRWCHSHLL